jgi:signal transduction histidine kinase
MTETILTSNELTKLLNAPLGEGEAANTIYDSPFLHLFVLAERKQLPKFFFERLCAQGEIIFRENEPGDTMYMIWAGRVAVVKGELQSPTLIGYRSVGEIIGEMALLENRSRSATVVALRETRLLGINREQFQQLLKSMPAVSLTVMEILSSRLRKSDEALSRVDSSKKQLVDKVEELQVEKLRLEEAQRLRQETSDLIIHDLRNPLSTILVSIKMLLMALPEEALKDNQELLDIAEVSCNRMMDLVNTLLEVSRMETGEVQMLFSQIDLGQMVAELLKRASVLDRKGIALRSDLPASLPLVTADKEKLERVLTNLVDNALKYTPEQGTVTVGVTPKDGMLALWVMDTGSGVPPEERGRIFERFAQLPGEKRKRRGFGLGLAYCKLTVEAHGGRIWIEEGDGGIGSRFIFTLPLKH